MQYIEVDFPPPTLNINVGNKTRQFKGRIIPEKVLSAPEYGNKEAAFGNLAVVDTKNFFNIGGRGSRPFDLICSRLAVIHSILINTCKKIKVSFLRNEYLRNYRAFLLNINYGLNE